MILRNYSLCTSTISRGMTHQCTNGLTLSQTLSTYRITERQSRARDAVHVECSLLLFPFTSSSIQTAVSPPAEPRLGEVSVCLSGCLLWCQQGESWRPAETPTAGLLGASEGQRFSRRGSGGVLEQGDSARQNTTSRGDHDT